MEAFYDARNAGHLKVSHSAYHNVERRKLRAPLGEYCLQYGCSLILSRNTGFSFAARTDCSIEQCECGARPPHFMSDEKHQWM